MDVEKETPQDTECLAAEVSRGAGDAAALPGRLGRYAQARHRSLEMAQFSTTKGAVKQAERLHSCGDLLIFRHYYTVDQVRLHAAQFCKQHLLCPLCAIRRGAKALKAYLDRLEVIRAENPNLRPYMVTFTVKNGEDLAERFNHLRRGLQRLHKARTGARQHTEAKKAAGAVWSYEVTNKGKGWHPHAHAIWLCEEAPDQTALSHEWHRLTGDSFVVDVRPIQGDPVEGFLEVFKYAVKFSGLSLEDNWAAYEVLQGERLLASFGCFRGVHVPESLTDEPLDKLPYVQLFYRFIPGAGYTFIPTKEPDHESIKHAIQLYRESPRLALEACRPHGGHDSLPSRPRRVERGDCAGAAPRRPVRGPGGGMPVP